ncbi:MAG: restriction endonuclease subunit M, partial [Lachnospiraceae bacterium]|nr:restriction endonuclease subunit M [Lachnospiraceae bacterium]
MELITNGTLLPRVQKDKEEQQSRTKAKAEVFTPSWICNKMNNFCDEQWFMRKDVFNKEKDDHTWIPSKKPIKFGKTIQKDTPEWQRYVDSRRIEITCGEAPYIVSRYDTTTGELLALNYRIGILDRKLRIVNENTTDEAEWLEWVIRAYEATYGFEFQGDNLFLARINLIQTFMDYYEDRFGHEPAYMTVKKIASIVVWNIWQMDGLKDTIPFGVPDDEYQQLSLF